MREKIKPVSSAGTGHFYNTTKNKKTMPDKMEIKKFDPVVRKYGLFREKSSNFITSQLTRNRLKHQFHDFGFF